MKKAITLFSMLSLTLIASGCETFLDMPSTTADMKKTTQEMNDTTKGMSKTTDKMDSKMEEVREGAHLQVVIGALTFMLDEKNTERLSPVPFDMLAGAKKFAEKAYEDELVDWFYVQLKNLRDTQPDKNEQIAINLLIPKSDDQGNRIFVPQYKIENRGAKKFAVPVKQTTYPLAYINKFNHKQDIILSAMEAVASFIPQEMIEKIVDMEIRTGGLRYQTALAILNMRDAFTRSALLESSLYEDGIADLEQVREANRLVTHLDYIAHLPYEAQIAATEIKGYLTPTANYIYAKQASSDDLAALKDIELSAGSASYTPAVVAFDPSAPINNLKDTLFTMAQDGLKVIPVNQNGERKKALAYSAAHINTDWTELLGKLQDPSLPVDVQNSPEAQSWAAEIRSHITPTTPQQH